MIAQGDGGAIVGISSTSATTKRTPARRWASGDDYRALAAYLCDRSIDFHTGDSVVFDGGYTVF